MTSVSTDVLEVRLDSEPSAETLADIRQRAVLARERESRLMAVGASYPFIVLTPLGMDHASWLIRQLDRMGVGVMRRVRIEDWPRAATPLYLRRFDRWALVRAAVYEESWRRISAIGTLAERWDLRDERDLACIAAAKQRLRAQCASLRVRARLLQTTFEIGLHAFHSPDLDQWAVEFARLQVT